MGEKDAKKTGAATIAADALVADLLPLGEVTSRKMFGGVGIFIEGTMFAIVDPAGTGYLRADDSTAADFTAAGAERHGRMPYWQIPAAVSADPDVLLQWAAKAAEVARAAKK